MKSTLPLGAIGEDEVHDEPLSTRAKQRRISHARMLEAIQRRNTALGIDSDGSDNAEVGTRAEEEATWQQERARKRARASRARARKKQKKEKRRLARMQSQAAQRQSNEETGENGMRGALGPVPPPAGGR